MYGPPRDCKRKARARRQVCANVFGLQWRSALLARMSCARVCPYKSIGCSFETIFGIRLRTRRCDCSFVLAAPCRPRWVKIARRSSAGKWERASASKPQASFPHYFMRQSRWLSAAAQGWLYGCFKEGEIDGGSAAATSLRALGGWPIVEHPVGTQGAGEDRFCRDSRRALLVV
jgi:hypothetical protein